MLAEPPTINVVYTGGSSLSLSVYHDAPTTFYSGSLVMGADPDGDIPHLTVANGAHHGTVTIDSNSDDLTYSPNAEFVGNDTFSICYVDVDGMCSDSIDVDIAITNARPTAVSHGGAWGADQYRATFDVYHDEPLMSLGDYVDVYDANVDPTDLVLEDDVTHGTLTFLGQNPSGRDGTFLDTPNPRFVGQDSFTFRAIDSVDATSVEPFTVVINVTNAAPTPYDDEYTSIAGDVVRVSISDLLQNDCDVDDSINPASFQLGPPGALDIPRIGDQLLITPPMPALGDPPARYTFTYTVTDAVGATGTVAIHVVATTLKEAWIATINREEAQHIGYRCYGAMNLGVFFTILRNNADLVDYQFGSTPGANAVYSPYNDIVTVATGTTVLNTTTVIHESVHIVDDMSDWYLSDSGVTWNFSAAERLGWAGEQLFGSTPLKALRNFENAVFDGNSHSVADVTIKWNRVLQQWADMPAFTYKYTYNPNQIPIGLTGWGDFFSKFGLSGLGVLSTVYTNELSTLSGYIPLSNSDDSGQYTVIPPLW